MPNDPPLDPGPAKPAAADKAATPRIVGLGASAGGLDALQQFFAHVPPASGLAYVVVQHLDPTHKAMLAELLQRATAMPVREASEAMRVQADTVYVIPPNSELSVAQGMLHVAVPLQPRGLRLPIDVLFSSLARAQGDRAVGVVLSGMGSDGTLGLLAIRSQGGLTLAQQPDTAQFDSMPRAAITAGWVDIVAPVAELPQRILRVAAPRSSAPAVPAAAGIPAEQALGAILGLLRERSKHDLSLYKPSTLLRRIDRRLAVHRLDTLVDYETFLQRNPQELDLLFNEMLIGVTSFFRDPAVWQELQATVMPALLERSVEAGPLRAWVVGCSTGEEAYSLAMVFQEALDALPERAGRTLKIFATDLSADAIVFARRGQYAAKSVADIAPERLARFFSAQGDGFQVGTVIREMVLFAQHDVILDPPFTKLDLLSCRNLLIYFNAPLQRRLVPLFQYSLRPGGVLVLGASETVGSARSLFVPLSAKSRLYRRGDNAADAAAVNFPIQRRLPTRAPAQEPNVPQTSTQPVNLQSLADHLLLQVYSPPAVLVNQQGDIVYISGRTGRYLEPAAGKANWNIHVMARPGIRTQLAVALRSAVQDGKPIELHGLRIDGDAVHVLDVTLQAVHEPRALEGMVMIVFRDVAPVPAAKARRRRPAGAPDLALADEMVRVQAEIQALREEMRASEEERQAANEELQSTNEELQSANEELQSTNEELTTTKEEAQSMNEELQTINSELQSKLEDLALAQADMQNLLNSTDIATLFLDNALNVRRFTEQITRIIQLRESDVGRPLSDLASTLTYPALLADVKETLRTLAACQKEIAATDGRWFSVRIMPYRTLANVIQGAVITFVDITAAKQLESRLREA